MPNYFVPLDRSDGSEIYPAIGGCRRPRSLDHDQADASPLSTSVSASSSSFTLRDADGDDDDMLAVLLRHSSPHAHKRALLLKENSNEDVSKKGGSPSFSAQHESATSATYMHETSDDDEEEEEGDGDSVLIRRVCSPVTAIPLQYELPVCTNTVDDSPQRDFQNPDHDVETMSVDDLDSHPQSDEPCDPIIRCDDQVKCRPGRHGSTMITMLQDTVNSKPKSPAPMPLETPTTARRRRRRNGSHMMVLVDALALPLVETPTSCTDFDKNVDDTAESTPVSSDTPANTVRRRMRRHGSNDMVMIETLAPPLAQAAVASSSSSSSSACPDFDSGSDTSLATTEHGRLAMNATPVESSPLSTEEEGGNIFLFLEEQQKEREKNRLMYQKHKQQALENGNPNPDSLVQLVVPKFKRPLNRTALMSQATHKKHLKQPLSAFSEGNAAYAPLGNNKHVHFGMAEVRTYGLTIDITRGPIPSYKATRSISSQRRHVVECPLTLDWAYASRTEVLPALELGYKSYFCNCPIKPLTVSERRMRVALVNNWSWKELELAESKAVCQNVIDMIIESVEWKLLQDQHGRCQDYGHEGLEIVDRWMEHTESYDAPPKMPEHDDFEVFEWKRNNPGFGSERVAAAEAIQQLDIPPIGSCDDSYSLDSNTGDSGPASYGSDSEWLEFVDKLTMHMHRGRRKTAVSLPCTEDQSDESGLKPGEVLSVQPSLLDSLDSCYRTHQGGRLALTRDGHNQSQHRGRLIADGASLENNEVGKDFIPSEIVPFADMNGLQMTEGRNMPDRREPLQASHASGSFPRTT